MEVSDCFIVVARGGGALSETSYRDHHAPTNEKLPSADIRLDIGLARRYTGCQDNPMALTTMATRLIIEGIVQGVGFRYALANEATALGLAGWVCNRRNGTVEACIKGPPPDVEALVAWSRHGPPGAHVTGVARSEADDADIADSGFHITATR